MGRFAPIPQTPMAGTIRPYGGPVLPLKKGSSQRL
jgi:hypothetical protein